MKKKKFRWGYAILWGIAFLFLISIPNWFKDSVGMGIVCVAITAIFAYLGYKSFAKEYAEKKPEIEKEIQKRTPKQKRKQYKGFPIENFKVDNLQGLFIYNEDFDYNASEVVEACLEDYPIYKFKFDLKPKFTRTDNGILRIMAEDRVIGDLTTAQALEMKDFINSHDECKPLLDVEGGEYRIYDSDEKTFTRGRDPWTATLLVEYYE